MQLLLQPATAGTRRASEAWQPRGNSPESLLEETNQESLTHQTWFQSGLHSLAPCCQERLFSKRLVPSFHTCLPNSIWARLYPPGSRLAHPDGLGAKDFQGEAWPRWASARRTPLREGARAQVEGPFLAGDGAPSLVWAPAQAAPGTAEPEREGQPERGCSSLCPHEGARAPPGPRCSSEARRGGSGKAPKAQAPGRGRGRMEA